MKKLKYMINSIYENFIPENHHTKIKCSLTTEDGSFLHPGSNVLTTRSKLMPGVFLEESLTKVLRKNVHTSGRS
jgi:hypothetical protein